MPRVTMLVNSWLCCVPMLSSVPLAAERLAAVDCVAILVGHSNIDYSAVLRYASLVFDAVNATRGASGKAMVERL